jgi:hypothetical protein
VRGDVIALVLSGRALLSPAFSGGRWDGTLRRRFLGSWGWTGLQLVTSVSDLCELFEHLLGEESKLLGREMKD